MSSTRLEKLIAQKAAAQSPRTCGTCSHKEAGPLSFKLAAINAKSGHDVSVQALWEIVVELVPTYKLAISAFRRHLRGCTPPPA